MATATAPQAHMEGAPGGGLIETTHSPHCAIRAVPLGAVRWTHGFWAERFRQCAAVTLPHQYALLADPERGHALTNLRIAAGLETGEYAGTNWQDEWVYKWLEAAAYIYDVTHDAALDRQMDDLIALIAAAQQPDGYLATQIIVRGWPRFQLNRHHELYVMGHLMQAACAHYRATGKDSFLHVARRVGDFLYRTFMPRDPALAHMNWNTSYIMGLVELYRTTHDARYLDVARVFIAMHGSEPGGSDQNQDRVPLREEAHVVGHMVFATYLYSSAADVYMETGDRALFDALERIWHEMTTEKLYLHGGVCAQHRGLSIRGDTVWEASGDSYALPNSTAYNETCAQIGNVMWNWRMLGITGAPRYADVMEQTLYNSILSGIGLDGASWFYSNVLRWYGPDHPLLSQDAHARFQPGDPADGRKHICCPSNLLRTIAGLHGYAYGMSDAGLWVNLYGANTFDGTLPNGTALRLTQETDYPWDGTVRLTLDAVSGPGFTLHLRVPAWATGATLAVNGTTTATDVIPGDWAVVERDWAAGDVVTLVLPMRVRLLEGNPRVEAARNQVAVQRGPVVYCLESTDLPDGVRVEEVFIPRDIALTPRRRPDLLNGVTILEGEAVRRHDDDWSGGLYRELSAPPPERVPLTLIPYYAWNNRGEPEMTIWMPLT